MHCNISIFKEVACLNPDYQISYLGKSTYLAYFAVSSISFYSLEASRSKYLFYYTIE